MNPSDFTLVYCFKNRKNVFVKSLESADKHLPKSVNFLLIDGGSDYTELADIKYYTSQIAGREIRNIDSSKNSLWEGWNYGYLHSSTRYVIYASSDVVFHSDGALDYIIQKLNEGCEYILLGNHAVFCIDRACLPRLGMWDERFNNGPHADCDYMIRASEAKIKVDCGPNLWYNHGDSAEESAERLGEGLKDRLPMNDLHNERWFKEKWLSNWPGWENAPDPTNLPHPPTSIAQVFRNKPEACPYPNFLKKMYDLYS